MQDDSEPDAYYHEPFAVGDLQAKKIQKYGEFLLKRALNIGNVVAFVGAGISTAYGRMSWEKLIDELVNEASATEQTDENKESLSLLRDLRAASDSPYYVTATDRNLIRAQLAATIIDGGNPGEFRKRVRGLTKDDTFETEALLSNGLNALAFCNAINSQASAPDALTRDWLMTFVSRVRASSQKERWLDCVPALDNIAHELKERQKTAARPSDLTAPDERLFYPLVFAAAALLHKPKTIGVSDLFVAKGKSSDISDAPKIIAKPNSALRPISDPLHQLCDTLGINRFLTTNYDFEIENYLKHRQYSLSDGTTGPLAKLDIGATPIGGRARACVVENETAADLIDFAAALSRFDYDVFHLHGRAGDSDRPIVTERDYQELYLSDGPTRQVFHEALKVVFAGNPILFVGLGMREHDLLRPLRQFVTNPEHSQNRPLFALLPADIGESDRSEVTLLLYLRFGVHALFYGQHDDDRLRRTTSAVRELRKNFDQIAQMLAGDETNLDQKAIRYNDAITNVVAASRILETPNKVSGDKGDSAALNEMLHGDPALPALPLIKAIVDRMAATRLTTVNKDALRSIALCSSSALTTLSGRLITIELCRYLTDLNKRRRDWWSNWRLPIRPRSEPSAEHVEGQFHFYLRHLVVDARRQAALDATSAPFECAQRILKELAFGRPQPKGRRILCVLAPRGGGKGQIFQEMQRAPQWLERGGYSSAFFANTRFSSEFASVIDGFTDFVEKCARTFVQTESPQTPRRPRLDEAIEALRARLRVREHSKRRYLVVIHGVETLFDAAGEPKTVDFAHWFRTLFAETTSDLPLDIVLLLNAERAGRILGDDVSSILARHRFRPENTNDSQPVEARFSPRWLNSDGLVDGEISGRLFLLDPLPASCVIEEVVQTVCGQSKDLILKKAPLNLFDTLYRASDYNRLTLTLVISLVARLASSSHTGTGPDTRAADWISTITDRLSSSAKENRANVVLESVISQHAELDCAQDRTECSGIKEVLLRHLAVFSIPVEMEVLARSPKIIQAVGPTYSHVSRLQRIETLLDELVRAGLVFEIVSRKEFYQKRGASVTAPISPRFRRFALHAVVQRHILDRMGGPRLELGDVHRFGVTTYGAQPLELPSPNAEVYDFLEELVSALIEYPEGTYLRPKDDERKGDEYIRGNSLCLRAALGILRSVFSIGVVLRFGDYTRQQLRRHRGFGRVEAHRLRVRWLLRSAAKVSSPENAASPQEDVLRPFYQDEITWLYNECALLSFIQGNIFDALALYEQAEASNRLVEGEQLDGPNGVGLELNRAIAEIERGHFARGERRLNSILEQKRTSPAMKQTVFGYLGLVSHVRGYQDTAHRFYAQALRPTSTSGNEATVRTEFRTQIIVHWRLGDLYRFQRDLAKARSELGKAIAIAESTQQHDLLNHARIAMARALDLSDHDDDQERAISLLDAAERYADLMGVPKLKAEALYARAKIMRRRGESRVAGEFAVESLSIAALNGMRVKLISASIEVATVAVNRKSYAAARQLIAAAQSAAERFGFQLRIESAEQLSRQIPESEGV